MHINIHKSMSDMSLFYATKVYYAKEKCENNHLFKGKQSHKHLSETSLT